MNNNNTSDMIGKLTPEQMNQIFTRQHIGRLSCYAAGEIYAVPLNYVYRKGKIFAHSAPGKKIEMMRQNPEVCFLVDEIRDTFNWNSVLCRGKFEEITDQDQKQQVLQALIHTLMPLTNQPSEYPGHGTGINDVYDPSIIIFEVSITQMTGRFEMHLNDE